MPMILLEYALFDEGRLIDESGTFKYEYFLKDHLGNTRVTFTDSDAEATADNLATGPLLPLWDELCGDKHHTSYFRKQIQVQWQRNAG